MSIGNLEVLRRQVDPAAQPASGGGAIPLPARRWKTRVAVPVVIFGLTGGLLAYAARGALRSAVDVRIVPAVIKAGVQGPGAAVVQAPGWVEPAPYPIAISALADGVVREVPVLEGEPVRAGEVVARLIDEDAVLALQRAEAELSERRAERANAEAALTAARANLAHLVEPHRRVASAEANLAERQAELDRWPAELTAEKARLAELDADYQRLSKLRTDGVAADIEFIRIARQREAQVGRVAGVEGRKAALEAMVEAARAELTAARESLKLLIAETQAVAETQARLTQAEAAVQRAETAKAEAELRLSRMVIRSPIDGVVMNRLVQPGSKVMLSGTEMASALVMRVYDPAKLQVRVDVPLGEAAQIDVGQSAEVVVGVLPDRIFAGRVARIVHEADIQKNTLQAKVDILDPAPEVKPEMLTRVRFLASPTSQPEEGAASLFIPTRLVGGGGDQSQVWLVDQNRNLAERRTIVLGPGRIGDWAEVRDGLRAGDWLITDPPAGLEPGDAVRVVGEVASSVHHATEEK